MEDDEGLSASRVPRALEMKSKLFGFELPDLLIIFLNLAITNLIFGATKFRYPLVWGTTAGIAAFLFFTKRGKPDNYLQHYGEFLSRPSYFQAGGPDLKHRKFKDRAESKKEEGVNPDAEI
ncbi:MAG: hypothetical protein JST04_12790 [Bdellovibrionales bacterium]|nr:hypothetical protein [Bdellovibrionales bacterium]